MLKSQTISSLYKYTLADFLQDYSIPIIIIVLFIIVMILFSIVHSNRRKKKQMEEKLALSEQLIEQQKRHEEQDRMITAMASDYRCVYQVDLDKDDAVCYREDPEDEDQTGEGIHFDYYERFKRYGESYVDEAYKKDFLEFIKPENQC